MNDLIAPWLARALALEGPAVASSLPLGLLWKDGDDGTAAAAATAAWLAIRWPSAECAQRVVVAGVDGLDPLVCVGGDADLPAPPAGPERLVLLAETSLSCDESIPPGIPYRPHLLSIAERNGWLLREHEDVSPALARWLSWVLARIQALPDAGQAVSQRTRQVLQRLQQRVAGLQQGKLVAEALCLERAARPVQLLVKVGPERSLAMRQLFQQVFGFEMGAAQWQWKYGDGRGCAAGIEQDGQLVAHYGGQRRDLLVCGRPEVGCQMCDVMVAPSANRSLVRRGPMHKLSATFLETQLGWGQPHRIGFGFPSDRHNGLADRLRLYTMVDRLVQLRWPARDAKTEPAAPALPPHRCEAITLRQGHLPAAQQRAIDSLWRAMAAEMKDVALGVRSADWLCWRYLQSPHAQYEVTLVRSRWWRRPLGIFVTRLREDALEMLDLVATAQHLPLLVALARRQAARAGKPALRLWVTRSQAARFAGIDAATLQQEEVPIQIPANLHTPGPDPRELQDRWFLMGGDADFT
jgi:hypothetical protein